MTGQELYEVLRDKDALHLEIEVRDFIGEFWPLEYPDDVDVRDGKVRLFS